MSLRTVAIVGAIATVLGFFLVFLPIFQNPILWGVPSTEPAPAYVLFGLAVFVIGSVILLYSLFAFTWRNRSIQVSRAKSLAVYKMSYKPAIAGAIVFLLVRAAVHLILPNLAGFPTSHLFDFGTLFVCAIVVLSVSYYLIRYYDKIPFENPIMKSIVLSTIALVILGGISTLATRGNAFYFMVYVLYGAATFTATGLVIGLAYMGAYGKQSPPVLEGTLTTKRKVWLYYLAVFGFIALFVVYGMYQDSLQPVSFTASGIHFEVSNGTVQVIANITNTSNPSMIQVNAAIDGLDNGVCGYGIETGKTMACSFMLIPLLSCSQVPQIQEHTLTLWAYFSNTRTLTNSYTITPAQLGCG